MRGFEETSHGESLNRANIKWGRLGEAVVRRTFDVAPVGAGF